MEFFARRRKRSPAGGHSIRRESAKQTKVHSKGCAWGRAVALKLLWCKRLVSIVRIRAPAGEFTDVPSSFVYLSLLCWKDSPGMKCQGFMTRMQATAALTGFVLLRGADSLHQIATRSAPRISFHCFRQAHSEHLHDYTDAAGTGEADEQL
jgi:hypothetical protein